MDLPNKGPALPPPIPRTRDQWILASLFLMAGYLIFNMSHGMFYSLFGWDGYGDFRPRYSADLYWDYRSLCTIPLALLADYFLDRRDSIVIGAFMAAFGLVLMVIPIGFFAIPGLVIFGAGKALFLVTLLAYFGTRWSGGMVRKDSGYGFLVVSASLGGVLSGLLSDLSSMRMLLPIVTIFLFIGIGILGIVFRKQPILAGEKLPPKRGSDKALGGVLIGVFCVVSMIGMGIMGFLEPDRDFLNILFTLGSVVTMTFGVVMLLTTRNYSNRERISMLILIGLTILFWAVWNPAADIMSGGWDIFGPDNGGSYESESFFSSFLPMLILAGLAALWMFYPKRGRGELATGLKVLGGIFVILLFPLLLKGYMPEGGPASGWYFIWTLLFQAAYMVVSAVFLSMIWKFSPAKLRSTAFAIYLSTGYLVYKVRRTIDMIFDRDFYFGESTFDTTTTFIGVLMLFTAGILVYVRMKERSN